MMMRQIINKSGTQDVKQHAWLLAGVTAVSSLTNFAGTLKMKI